MVKDMEYKITEKRGRYDVAVGSTHLGGIQLGNKPGCTMKCFIVKESRMFDTLEDAERFVDIKKQIEAYEGLLVKTYDEYAAVRKIGFDVERINHYRTVLKNISQKIEDLREEL